MPIHDKEEYLQGSLKSPKEIRAARTLPTSFHAIHQSGLFNEPPIGKDCVKVQHSLFCRELVYCFFYSRVKERFVVVTTYYASRAD